MTMHIRFDDGEDEEDELDLYEQHVLDLDPSPKREQELTALVVALAALAARLPGRVSLPEHPSDLVTAEAAGRQVREAVSIYTTSAMETVRKHAPGIAEALAQRVQVQSGTSAALDIDSVAERFVEAMQRHLPSSAREIEAAAHRAIADWHGQGGSITDLRAAVADALADAEWQVMRLARTEIQNAYKDLAREGMRQAKARCVRRVVTQMACAFCKAREGVHEYNDPDLYDTHPQCECQWEAASCKDLDFSSLLIELAPEPVLEVAL